MSIDYGCDNRHFRLPAHNCEVPTSTSQKLEAEQQMWISGIAESTRNCKIHTNTNVFMFEIMHQEQTNLPLALKIEIHYFFFADSLKPDHHQPRIRNTKSVGVVFALTAQVSYLVIRMPYIEGHKYHQRRPWGVKLGFGNSENWIPLLPFFILCTSDNPSLVVWFINQQGKFAEVGV